MRSSTVLALAASLSTSNAVFQGFNYASTKPGSSDPMTSDDFKTVFAAQQMLEGTSGFTSARLYTMIQAGTTSDPISAFDALKDDSTTTLLLGMWTSADSNQQAVLENEITALKAAMKNYPDLGSQIAGISVGSEDMYRVSNLAKQAAAPVGPGNQPSLQASFINQVKGNLTDGWKGVKVGHVDTWTAFANSDNSFPQSDVDAVIDACDFLGVDAYPYFQNSEANAIENSVSLFDEAYQRTLAASKGKDVWITETGWPIVGNKENQAVPSKGNAQYFWDNVGCPNFGKTNIWWYTYMDTGSPLPNFGVVDSLDGGATNWNLSCKGYTSLPDVNSGNATSSSNSTGSAFSTGKGSGSSTTASSPGSTGGSSSSGSGSSAGSGSGSGSGSSSQLSGAATLTGSFVAVVGGMLVMVAAL